MSRASKLHLVIGWSWIFHPSSSFFSSLVRHCLLNFWEMEHRFTVLILMQCQSVRVCPDLGFESHREGVCGWRFAANSSRSKIVTGQQMAAAIQHYHTAQPNWSRPFLPKFGTCADLLQRSSKIRCRIAIGYSDFAGNKAEESRRFTNIFALCPLLPRQSQASTSRQSRCGSTWPLFCATFCRTDPCGHRT